LWIYGLWWRIGDVGGRKLNKTTCFEKQLTAAQVVLDSGFGSNPGENDILYRRRKEMAEIALSALTPPTQEQMERVFGGSWEGSADGYADGELIYDMWTCSKCGHLIDEEDDPDMLPDFCPKCGAANTDKAREIVKKRLEVLNDATD